MSTELIPAPANDMAPRGPVGPALITDEHRSILKGMVDRNATPAQVEMLIVVGNRYDLDPLMGHVVLINGKCFVTHKGLMHKAHTSGQFDGIETGYGKDELGEWCECRVWRKDMGRPFVGRIYLSEYRNSGPVWKQYPRAMAAKCFDEETSVLTDLGFQPFHSVTGRILQVTETGLEPTDARPFVQAYAGDMVCFDSDDLNFCVTPNHDMVTAGGKVEAGVMYEEARRRPRHFILRCVGGSRPDAPIPDAAIRLAAAYLADGHDTPHRLFNVVVSRPRKVAALDEIGLHEVRRNVRAAGHEAVTPSRTITTRADKVCFGYAFEAVAALCGRGKTVNLDAVLSLSRRQARLFVDALVEFDGSRHKHTGARTFRTSNPCHLAAFEVAAHAAGYCVNEPYERDSDIPSRPNYTVAISERDGIPVARHGRAYNNREKEELSRYRPGLELRPNGTGRVWCCTVPSGIIVVRRHGFSMLCGNCSESFVLRRAFDVALTSQEEMGVSEMGAPEGARRPAAEAPEDAAWKAARRAASAAIKALDSEGKAFWSDEIARRFGTADLNAMTRQDLEDVALLIAEAQAVIVRAAEEDPFADDDEAEAAPGGALLDVPPVYDKPGHGDH